jgi:hypothetical protein
MRASIVYWAARAMPRNRVLPSLSIAVAVAR